ncbi:hypothetical protein [Polaribacter sp. Asnod6-C07]|uniref:hypothetical protein n=1 Tax=Polaribacter sp. Asnod6-C07 TaxID=3160582 RepID=UPI00386A5056
MRNYILIFLLILSHLSCKTEKEKDEQNLKTETEFKNKSLNGVWIMTSYFDSIVENRTISKYRMKTPTWFALIIEISNDSIHNYGSIINDSQKINFKSDTLAILSGIGVAGDWILQKKDQTLILNHLPNEYLVDTTSYTFEKRKNLEFLIEKDSENKIDLWKSTTDYFNEKIIFGKYINKKDTIIFGKNRKVRNFKDFENYRIVNYFGTSHPFNPYDVIFLTNENEFKPYNWKFDNNKLILTNFIPKEEIYKGKKYVTDDNILGNEIIELIKIE